jgi:uncharacterized damage-inducible protein DinB
MNSLMTHGSEVLQATQAIRGQLMAVLSDADLAYKLPGKNPTLGEVCVGIGQTQQIYIDSFQTFQINWTPKPVDPALYGSVERLNAWYAELDQILNSTLANLSEEDVQNKIIDRGFPATLTMQMHVYREALLIFYAKAIVYLNALGKPISEQAYYWIG